MQHIHAVFGFEIGYVLLGNSSVTVLYIRDKAVLRWQPILGQKLLLLHINALLREITRMWLLITGGFCGRPIQRRHFWLQGSKGRRHGNQFLAKIGQKITKMAITSVVCNISMHSLVLREGLRHQGIHLWHSRTQGTKGRYNGNQFWD